MGLELESYRGSAQRFCERFEREHYLHLAGHKPQLEIGAIYRDHAELFAGAAVSALRDAAADGEPGGGARHLALFAFSGLLGAASRAEEEELARLEAGLTVDAGTGPLPYRQVPAAQANESDGERRWALEQARDAVLTERLQPLYLRSFERSRELCRELGWPSYAEAVAELRGIDLRALARAAARFLDATREAYAAAMRTHLAAAGLPPLGELRRSDLARLWRAPGLDRRFAAGSMVESLRATLGGLGTDLRGQANVHLDTERRATKSPRAFCAPVRVPDEVYLVVSPIGGTDDYAALFHEAGHAQHYAHVDAELPFELRHLGDNSVTESFAFLLEHLVVDVAWLGKHLVHDDVQADLARRAREHARAVRLYFLRRYAAKLVYELELHDAATDLSAMPDRYATLLADATGVRWTPASWLADVDDTFYVACYLRAWALETHWRRALRARHGERWFESGAAGDWLRSLWSQGQRLDAAELLVSTLGDRLDFSILVDELGV